MPHPLNPPRRSRGPFVILSLIALIVLLGLLALFNNYRQASKPWSELLLDIQDGKVLRLTIDQDDVLVIEKGRAGDAKEVDYSVDYPGGALSDTLLKQLHDQIADYHQHHQGPDDSEIVEKGVPARTLFSQILPWAVLSLMIYAVVFRRAR